MNKFFAAAIIAILSFVFGFERGVSYTATVCLEKAKELETK